MFTLAKVWKIRHLAESFRFFLMLTYKDIYKCQMLK